MHAFRIADGLEDRLDRERPVAGDHIGQFQRLLQGLTVRNDMSDESDVLGLRGLDVSAGQQDVAGDRVRDLAGQPHRGSAHRVQAPLHLRDTEFGALTRDTDIGGLQNLGATGDCGTFDGRDERFGQTAPLE
ncbi:Uncharacterised protein [Mycobacteroides abscessus subsp. abscessus]|nr:Uncharacterised protein [Mycobacteroides abscessus subsp. abscessus]